MTPLELLRQEGSELFHEAQNIARTHASLFTTGLQINTFCLIDPPCKHCLWRSRERYTPNYRRKVPLAEIVKRAQEAKSQEIDQIYMASGWMGADLPKEVYEAVQAIKQQVDIKLFGMFGSINRQSLLHLKEAGIDGYRCSLESPNPQLFSYLKPGDSLRARVETLQQAKAVGLPIWSEFIIGVGESEEDIAQGLEMFKTLNVGTISLVPFQPVPYTEMEQRDRPNPYWFAKVTAAARIFLREIDVFAVYYTIEWGFRAGCNGAFVILHSHNTVPRLREMRRMLYNKEN
jgi:biotin synthase